MATETEYNQTTINPMSFDDNHEEKALTPEPEPLTTTTVSAPAKKEEELKRKKKKKKKSTKKKKKFLETIEQPENLNPLRGNVKVEPQIMETRAFLDNLESIQEHISIGYLLSSSLAEKKLSFFFFFFYCNPNTFFVVDLKQDVVFCFFFLPLKKNTPKHFVTLTGHTLYLVRASTFFLLKF